jgi:hypothetical protein
MKRKIERPQSFTLLISQSFNQESLNQRITQSTNQPIKKASARSDKNSRGSFQVSPVAGRLAEKPKNSNHKGRGPKRLRLRHRQVSGRPLTSDPEGSRSSGKLGLRGDFDSHIART